MDIKDIKIDHYYLVTKESMDINGASCSNIGMAYCDDPIKSIIIKITKKTEIRLDYINKENRECSGCIKPENIVKEVKNFAGEELGENKKIEKLPISDFEQQGAGTIQLDRVARNKINEIIDFINEEKKETNIEIKEDEKLEEIKSIKTLEQEVEEKLNNGKYLLIKYFANDKHETCLLCPVKKEEQEEILYKTIDDSSSNFRRVFIKSEFYMLEEIQKEFESLDEYLHTNL